VKRFSSRSQEPLQKVRKQERDVLYKVLLVDDEALIREAISENTRWNELGYELIGTCKNGREAIESLERETPDLVLTDICMPHVDGMELTRYIYERHKEIKVIIISGYDDFEYAKNAVKYHVMDYILKPITASELAQTLTRVREQMDEERMKANSIQKIKGAYFSNLPILRGRFLNSLLMGNVGEEELKEKLSDYRINLRGNDYMTALVTADDLSPFLQQSEEYKSDLAYFAIYNISEEIVSGYGVGVTFQDVDERTVVIFGNGESVEEEALKITEEIHDSILKFLKLHTTIGLGRRVGKILELPRSFHDARQALEFKFLLGGDQVIYAKDFLDNQDPVGIQFPMHVRSVCQAIRCGNQEEVRETICGFIEKLRGAYLSRNRSVFHVQNLILSIMREIDMASFGETEILKEERELLNAVYTKEHLSEIETDLICFCIDLSENFRDEKDNYCKRQAMRALDYIEEHYGDSEVSLNSVCSYLAMSTSYFSSVFKNYTGETFIEALTKKRMEKARYLLENTNKKTYEIAGEVGYSDPHYFSSTFKRMTGMTPTEYTKKVR
jgi:two-component system response regulator YesN